MYKKILSNSIVILTIIMTLLSTFSNIVFANTEISRETIKDGGDCGRHLQFWDTKQNAWSDIITSFNYYEENGVQYPAYCLEKDLPGVGGMYDKDDYDVTIDKLIDDIRLWRVVINSYPYQTPETMGVTDKFDAYTATKQSIYCILYGTNPSTYYKGVDARGVAIKNTIERLVDIGRNGSQTRENTDVTINKIQNLYQDGDYYTQEYTVNSPVETSQYTITGTNGLPSGSKITDISNNEKTTFNGSEHFKVKIPKNQLSTDINGTIVLQAKCKTYPVFFGATTIPGTQDYLLSYDPFGDVTGRTTLNIKTNTGKIKISKTDSETSQPIEGVTFQLTTQDGKIVANATTDSLGEATFSGLYPNLYKLKEISTNENYVLNQVEFDVNVEYNGTTNKNITNDHKKGNLKIYKVDKDNNKIALGNVKFDLYSEEFGRVIGTYTTNVDGEIEINDLRIGKYKLIEKNTRKMV